MEAYILPSAMLICMAFGFAFKVAIPYDRAHDFIPLMCACMGVVLVGIFVGWSLDNIAAGAVSGIAATGLWEQFVHLLPPVGGLHGEE